MQVNDPRAAQFNADVVRDALKFAMKMGTPNPEENRCTFRWQSDKSYSVADLAGNPYHWDQVPDSVLDYDDIQVDVAVEFIPRSTLSGGTALGGFDTPRAVITILDVDWELVTLENTATPRGTPDLVLLGTNTYKVGYVAPDIGLFDMNVFSVQVSAIDES